ncbi:hypothetical protein PFFCH_04731 [Plasmodium falciparum FCH/4]|uniref:Surface antigen n=1 Tax=Plasmodium falciparum FCH/4 TaxID=1036724 RepID=A0A024VIY9_PLAFA|nr:hypothetical protein PFFCH_04731 [Plasmodium falciparum FCH/4]
MSTIEKDLLETYKEVFGDESDMLESGMYPNVDEKSSICECADINNIKLGKTKGRDKYLKHLKGRCTRGIYISSLTTVILTTIALYAARAAAIATFATFGETYSACASYVTIFNMLKKASIISTLKGVGACTTIAGPDIATPATTAALGAIYPCGIAALVLLILTVLLIILYIWLYRRRKRSWKHECKKHLCK